ncbi:hypothetical protein ACSNOI_37010 [Actinomadura kijaniata]|uniref:hypothetical protein n=1 Tax=Actinomadura kijaniata TaxID=46161 RepID=UPI003F1CFE3A
MHLHLRPHRAAPIRAVVVGAVIGVTAGAAVLVLPTSPASAETVASAQQPGAAPATLAAPASPAAPGPEQLLEKLTRDYNLDTLTELPKTVKAVLNSR